VQLSVKNTMKKILMITVLAMLTLAPFSTAKAQYGIASYEVELLGYSITFEEEHPPGLLVAERRKMKIVTSSENISTDAKTSIMIYKVGASILYGPFTIDKFINFEFEIDKEEWGVEIIAYEPGTLASVWIDQ
jgi:hypothetical protein